MTQVSLQRFIALTLALSWGLAGLYLLARLLFPVLPPLDGGHPVFLLATCAPSLAAMIVAAMAAGWSGVDDLLRRALRPFAWPWLVVALGTLPAIVIAAAPFHMAVVSGTLMAAPVAIAATPLILFNIPAFGEEFGWRGLVLPHLLSRQDPYAATVTLWLMRVIWHLPAFVLGGLMTPSWDQFGGWLLSALGLTALMTGLYLRANGNVIVAGIVPHAMINILGALGLWSDDAWHAGMLAACGGAFLVLTVRKPAAGPAS